MTKGKCRSLCECSHVGVCIMIKSIACTMIKNAGELIALAQQHVSISYSFRLLVEIGGGKYLQHKWLTWHNTVVS